MKIRDINIPLAILPFSVSGENERLHNLFTGFTEDLIVNFSKFVGLSVVSQYSTSHIKNISDVSEIEKLKTDFLVVGSVREIKDGIRISIQLIKSEDNSIVFAAQHDETIESILEAQDKMIQQIVSVLQQRIDYNLLSYSYKKNTVDLAVYENYLIGMDYIKKGSVESDTKAREYFESALSIDEHYAPAYTGLSMSYFNEWSCQLWERWDISKKGAHDYAMKAIEKDPNDYVALGVLGRTYCYLGEYEKAEHCLRKSIRINPNDVANLLRVSFSLMYVGYASEAIEIYERAIELHPHHKDEYFAYGATYNFAAGNFEECIALSKKTGFSSWVDLPAIIAAAYFHLEDFDNMWKCWDIFLTQYIELVSKNIDADHEEAISWVLMINPFKKGSYLDSFSSFISKEKKVDTTGSKHVNEKKQATFIQREDLWEINFQDKKVFLKDAKGFHDIHKVLLEPKEEFHCMDLMGSNLQDNVNVKVIDATAKLNYQERIRELQSEIDEAEIMNNSTLLLSLREEYDFLLDHISSSMGLAGKARKVGSSVEKARSAITWRIRSAIKKIKKTHPQLADHLARSIKTGTYCSYKPEVNIHWKLR